MGPKINEVETDNAVPLDADVVVIGAGIIGLMCAYFLAERRLSVVVVEKGHIACEQSSRNWGWCRQSMRDPREFDLIREALRLWPTLNERLMGDTGFRTSGIVFASRSDEDDEGYRNWIADAAQSGINAELVHGAALRSLIPGDTSPPRAGLYCANDGRAEPQWAAPVVAQAARRLGAKIVCRCAARGIETADGRVVSVVTERGTIATKTAVVAGGAWSRRLLKDLGVDLPQLKVRSSVARTTPLEGGPECALWDGRVAYRKRVDGGYTIADGSTHVVPLTPDSFRFFGDFTPMLKLEWRHLRLRLNDRFLAEWRESKPVPLDRPSPYEAARVLDPEPDTHFLHGCLGTLQKRYPKFAALSLAQCWAGFIDATPDAIPVISEVAQVSGVVVATGFSGHGFGISPAAGYLAADLASGVKPLVDPHHFRLTRFFDGSRHRPLMGV
jgi:glycine/D-amino acid oxidase-like deaminating enzyme